MTTAVSVTKVKVPDIGLCLQYSYVSDAATGKPLRWTYSNLQSCGVGFQQDLKAARDLFLKENPKYAVVQSACGVYDKLVTQFTLRQRKDKSTTRPSYVLAILDHPDFCDRYTVFLGGEFLVAPAGELRTDKNCFVQYLGVSSNPASPFGVSQFGECHWREYQQFVDTNRRRIISWDDLPMNVRQHIRARCE